MKTLTAFIIMIITLIAISNTYASNDSLVSTNGDVYKSACGRIEIGVKIYFYASGVNSMTYVGKVLDIGKDESGERIVWLKMKSGRVEYKNRKAICNWGWVKVKEGKEAIKQKLEEHFEKSEQPALQKDEYIEVRDKHLLKKGVNLYFNDSKNYWGTVVEVGEKYDRYSGEVEPTVLIYFPELPEEAEEIEKAERIKKYCRGEKVNMSGLEVLGTLDAKTLKDLCSSVDKTYQKGWNKVWHFVSSLLRSDLCVKADDPALK